MRQLRMYLLLVVASLFVQTASANEKLDCLDNLLDLGVATKLDMVFSAEPAEALQLRKDLAIRVWVGYWVYDAGLYDKAQLSMQSYADLLQSAQDSGKLDLAASGQPDVATLHGAADTCVNNPPVPLVSGLRTLQSGSDEREYYLQLPSDYGEGDPKPLLFAFHGYTGQYQNWVGEGRYYDLVDVVGDDAIFIAPNALPNAAGQRVWGGQDDFNFFLDMISDLELLGLVFDPNQVFAAGHSNGAGFTHDLSCEYGDVIRGIATAAGALTNNECAGSIAALMMQGSNDPLTNSNLALKGLRYWVLYNGWEEEVFDSATVGPCDDYSITDPEKPGNLPYPVLWCEHTQGHAWPDYASQTVWDFFSGLPDAAPVATAPPGGGNDAASLPKDTTLTFQLDVPADINRPLTGVGTLRPVSYLENPTCSAPPIVLSQPFSVDGKMVPGEVSDPITIDVAYFDFTGGLVFPSTWTLSIVIYVEGGSTGVIPTPFVDHEMKVLLTLVDKNTPVVIPDIQALTPIPNLCGF
jgi:polyhydroxybutyrate depolymerase